MILVVFITPIFDYNIETPQITINILVSLRITQKLTIFYIWNKEVQEVPRKRRKIY
jgi:hypothetical protein